MTLPPGVSASAWAPNVRGRRTNQPSLSTAWTPVMSSRIIAFTPLIARSTATRQPRCCAGLLRCVHDDTLRAKGALMGHGHKLSEEDYQKLLEPMSEETASMARWVAETGQRIVVLFEGRDTAGKGGSIDMIARILNPRQCRVAALPSPTEREQAEWYFQRYI